MNVKRALCLALAVLLALLPLATLAEEQKYVKNTGTEPVGVFAAIGDSTPVRPLNPGEQVKWLGEETVAGALWYAVEGGFVPAGPSVEVIVPGSPAPQATEPPTQPTDPPVQPVEPGPSSQPSPVENEPEPTPQGSDAPEPSPAASADPEPSPAATAGPEGSPAASADPEATPSASDGPEPSPSASTDPEPSPAASDDPGPSPAASADPEPSPAATAGPSPSSAPSPSATATPRPGGASDTELVIDTAYTYPGMEKSYADGYMPTVSGGKALFVLPLLGDALGDVVRVTPDISTSGPFLYGNYQFDLNKSAQTATDSAGNQVSRQAFLVSLALDLAKNRYNGTYPLTFHVSYTDKHGDPAEQDFTLQVTITDGKDPGSESGGGGWSGGPTAVRKPVLVLESGEIDVDAITGGQGFTLTVQVKNVGDLPAKNVRILAGADGQGVYRSDSLAPVFLTLLGQGESTQTSFPFASDKTVFAGRHGLSVTLAYEDVYGNCYGDTVPLQIIVRQEASIDFDEMKLPETVTSGDTFTQPVCVYNTGYAPVYNVRCTLRMDGLIAASAFLGTLEPQQSADKAISVFVTTLSGKEKYGTTYGELIISYEDMAGQAHTEYQQLQTAVQAPVEITDEEKLKQEKEQKEQQTLSQWWVSLLVSIAFILIILSVIVIARFSRMLKMK